MPITLSDDLIREKLESIHEHQMAKDIFVPILKKMDTQGVKYTGGAQEHGIDVEYYEISQPDKKRKYTGIQFKKGDLKYGAGGNKNTVKEVKNQAEEAFEKDIYGLENNSKQKLHRFICAVTGEINETARTVIGKAQTEKGGQIDYWEGSYLAQLIRDHWSEEFIEYFNITEEEAVADNDQSEQAISADYIEENFPKLVIKAKKVRSTLNRHTWRILRAIIDIGKFQEDEVTLPALLLELGSTEDAIAEEMDALQYRLEYLRFYEDGTMSLAGNATDFGALAEKIVLEIVEAEEDTSQASKIFDEILE